jgi:hypothetical protein
MSSACVFCHEQIDLSGPEPLGKVTEHILTCAKHPAASLRARIRDLELYSVV